jgi:hypothetical protein
VSPQELSLAAAGALVAVASVAISLVPPKKEATDVQRAALVFQTLGEVKRRPAETLGWQRLATGMGVFNADAVFVPPGGQSALRFDDGTELFLEERSLVVVEQAPRGRRLRLRQGAVSGRVGDQSIAVDTPMGQATLEASSEVRVELGASKAEVTVRRGSALVGGGKPLLAGQRATAGPQGFELLPPWPLTLVAPDAQTRRVFTGAPGPMKLEWRGSLPRGARLQLARDRLFAFVERDASVAGTAFDVDRPSPGVTWWRLVDERGAPLSEARRFVLVEDVAPVAMAPADGEVVLAPPGTKVAFGWTALSGTERYRLELGASESFAPVVLTEEVSSPNARLVLALAEGTWYWRVRSVDGAVAGAPSKPSRFRLIHRGIPEAPELLKPEIEVDQ